MERRHDVSGHHPLDMTERLQPERREVVEEEQIQDQVWVSLVEPGPVGDGYPIPLLVYLVESLLFLVGRRR